MSVKIMTNLIVKADFKSQMTGSNLLLIWLAVDVYNI